MPENLLQAAKNWEILHTQNTNDVNTIAVAQGGNSSISINKNHLVTASHILAPNWKDAKLQKLSSGETQIVVASPEYPLDPKSRWSAIRKFIYNVKDNQIVGGKIVEMFGKPDGSDAGTPVYTQIDDHHRTRDMPWNAYKGVWGPWVYFSEETGNEYSNTGEISHYVYTSIVHNQDHIIGTPSAGSITFSLNNATGSISGDGSQGTMTLNWTEITSITCVFNLELQRINGSSTKTWPTP